MTVNVLADRHHGGLYRSLQLLADRLGWDLYTPVGTDWESERYWAFGMNQGITDRLAQQYLVPHDGVWEEKHHGFGGGVYETRDPEFPGSVITGVTLGVARHMDWAYVIASLDDNQWGFSRFAHEVSARFVVQVGNTGQYVAWNLDPLALVSSEVPIVGRGVRYHQEMDPAASSFVKPEWMREHWARWSYSKPPISSFVNCFPSIGSCYDGWTAMRQALPDFQFLEYGIDGAEGVLKPIGALAAAMGSSLFGYHCKTHGDGFGHVIHGWAAVGRPIIGHSSHYRGKMAEHLWRHGETCIDLDVVSIPEAARMVRDIAADPDRHAAMCHAIRAEYDRIDHDAEAAAIKALLA